MKAKSVEQIEHSKRSVFYILAATLGLLVVLYYGLFFLALNNSLAESTFRYIPYVTIVTSIAFSYQVCNLLIFWRSNKCIIFSNLASLGRGIFILHSFAVFCFGASSATIVLFQHFFPPKGIEELLPIKLLLLVLIITLPMGVALRVRLSKSPD